MRGKRSYILPIIFIIGAFLIGANLMNNGSDRVAAQETFPGECYEGICYDCQADPETGTDPSCGNCCNGGDKNERGSLECTGLNVQGNPAPGVTVKLTCSANYVYAGKFCNPRTYPPFALFYISTDNGVNWSSIIQGYDDHYFANRLKVGEPYDYTIPATTTGNISFKCETYAHSRTDYNGEKRCWVGSTREGDTRPHYLSAWRATAPVCQQSFTPTKLNFKCDNLARNVYEPQPGSTVRYTCEADGTGYNSADFRVTVNGTVPADPNATVQIPQGQTSAAYDYTVPADATTVTADCRVCNDAATRVCTEWGVSNITKTVYEY